MSEIDQLYENLRRRQEPKGYFFNKERERVNELLEGAVVFVGLVGFGHIAHQLCEFIERPLVDWVEVGERQGILGRIEVVETTDLITQGVAQVAVVVGHVLDDAVRDRHITAIVLRADP